MLYTKPAVTLIGKAINAVQNTGKNDDSGDSHLTVTNPAYEADE